MPTDERDKTMLVSLPHCDLFLTDKERKEASMRDYQQTTAFSVRIQ